MVSSGVFQEMQCEPFPLLSVWDILCLQVLVFLVKKVWVFVVYAKGCLVLSNNGHVGIYFIIDIVDLCFFSGKAIEGQHEHN